MTTLQSSRLRMKARASHQRIYRRFSVRSSQPRAKVPDWGCRWPAAWWNRTEGASRLAAKSPAEPSSRSGCRLRVLRLKSLNGSARHPSQVRLMRSNTQMQAGLEDGNYNRTIGGKIFKMPQSTESEPVVGRGRYWLPRIGSAILAPILFFGIVEMVLRFSGVGFSTELLVPCTLKGQPAACYNLFFAAPFFPPGMIKTPQVYAVPTDKPQGTFRIFVFGESAAMGDPDPAYAFSRYLDVMLRERFPSMKFEVVNTGSVAINSHVLLPIAKGLAEQHPDLFIIYSGNNEVVGPYGPGTALTTSGMSLPVIRTSIFVRSTRIGQFLTKVGTQKKEWRGMEMFLDKQVRESSPLMQYSYANFEQNLRDTVAVAHNSGTRVIISTVATNLKDCGPFS